MLYLGKTIIDSELSRGHCLATQAPDVLQLCYFLSVTWSDACGTLPSMNAIQGHFISQLKSFRHCSFCIIPIF